MPVSSQADKDFLPDGQLVSLSGAVVPRRIGPELSAHWCVPLGSGMTALLSCMEGVDVPTSGSTDVLGLHLVKGSQVLVQRIGVQLQHEALLPRLKEGVALDRYSSFDPRPAPWRPLL